MIATSDAEDLRVEPLVEPAIEPDGAPDTASTEGGESDTDLVVIDSTTRVRRRSRRAVLGGFAVLAVMFIAVLLQLSLMSGQRELDSLRNDLEAARLHQEQLRRDESLLQSPEGIIEMATTELGMVPAEAPAVVIAPEIVIAPVSPGVTTP